MTVVQDYGEIRMEGLRISIEIFHSTYNVTKFSSGFHQHPFYELSVMTNGTVAYKLGQTESIISASDGKFIMIPPFTRHCRNTLDAPSNIAGFQLRIAASNEDAKRRIEALPGCLQSLNYRLESISETAPFIRKLLRELMRKRPFWQMKAGLLMQEYLCNIFRRHLDLLSSNSKTVSDADTHHEYIALLADRFIEENIGHQISVGDIAAHCSLSPRHLNRIYREIRGVPIGRAIINARIDSARQMLVKNDRLVKDISEQLGFSSVTYFCRIFRQITGFTPDEYRDKR